MGVGGGFKLGMSRGMGEGSTPVHKSSGQDDPGEGIHVVDT